MTPPFFYAEEITIAAKEFVLNEETSKHVVQVLRMQAGEQLQLTDGRGNLFTAKIIDASRKNCNLAILSCVTQPRSPKQPVLAVSLVKNAHRFEWLLEKATEIGVSEIVPLLCSRTEKQHFRVERMRSILVSAMLQSQQVWLPVLHEPIKFAPYIKSIKEGTVSKKFIAHCEKDEPRIQLNTYQPFDSSVILIGPEGDFTIDEIELALQNGFTSVALGDTRLRTETAGVVATTILSLA
ncbi:MAG: rRNA ((1498)-N(3))-methyltransferase [Ferruginibacter sp.]|nr:rRNA ((1498)-N(3))-methyltransferase [Ferruginibacter sp.]